MVLQKEYLDVILVPTGLFLMIGYHLFLLYRIRKFPHTTVIGYENHNKRAWVEGLMQGDSDMKDTGIALTVIASNIGAATYLASLSIGLSSLIGAWVGSSSNNIFMSDLIYGDRRSSTISIKDGSDKRKQFLVSWTSSTVLRHHPVVLDFWSHSDARFLNFYGYPPPLS
ncbi:uncharacterized protein LOC113287533 [Papaver somniferum]|uniref:uncharacterized protein LOC113287533 n=1 Tax=Papaver somniferum TaxID=3469 RepID=UPI000E6FF5AB|nr:uncharacterized protein LOC113287533 [Papaver somniferum]